MDFYKVPIGFGLALAMNPNAMNAYSAMTEEQKKAILARPTTQKAKSRCAPLSILLFIK